MTTLSTLYTPTSVWLADDPTLSIAQARMFVWREVLGDMLADVGRACNERLPDQACVSIDETVRLILAKISAGH